MTSERASSERDPHLRPGDPYADPAGFWAEQGKGMLAPWDPVADATPPQLRAEAKLLEVLRHLEAHRNRPIRDIFEAGCGRGRLAHFFHRNWPDAKYTAIDVGALQLAEAQRLVPTGHFSQANLLTYEDPRYDATEPSLKPFEGYDLVIASEVLMHIRPHEIKQAFERLFALVDLGDETSPEWARPAGHLVFVEWAPLPGELEATPTAYWNFPHNYPVIVRNMGASLVLSKRTDRQMIYVAKP